MSQMLSDPHQPETEFKLKFDGKLNEVNATTLGYSLVYVSTIIREIAWDLSSRIEIRVKSTAPGSFVVGIALEALNDPLFQAHVAAASGPLALTVIDTLTKLFNLRKALKGEPPKEATVSGDNIEITAGNNAKINIDNRTFKLYFNHPEINEALSRTFQALDSDKSISGFEITDTQEKPLFEATSEVFAALASISSVPQPEKRDMTDETHVYVVKPSFDPKLKWTVLYKGIRTEVSMRDREFQARVEGGQPFAKGDILSVTLVIHQKLDPTLNTYVNKSYDIVKVHSHIPRSEQPKLWDGITTLGLPDPFQKRLK